jgi:DNA-binding NtrC family response regulator
LAATDFDAHLNKWIQQHLSRGQGSLLTALTDHVAKRVIAEALAACNGNRSQTAKRLGISRPTLLYRLAKYGLDIPL